jgi:hypothetical protein
LGVSRPVNDGYANEHLAIGNEESAVKAMSRYRAVGDWRWVTSNDKEMSKSLAVPWSGTRQSPGQGLGSPLVRSLAVSWQMSNERFTMSNDESAVKVRRRYKAVSD